MLFDSVFIFFHKILTKGTKDTFSFPHFLRVSPGGGGGGDSIYKKVGMLVENFEIDP